MELNRLLKFLIYYKLIELHTLMQNNMRNKNKEEKKHFAHFFECDASVTFIDSNSEFVLDALHCEILSYRFHLFASKVVVVLILPVFLDVDK